MRWPKAKFGYLERRQRVREGNISSVPREEQAKGRGNAIDGEGDEPRQLTGASKDNGGGKPRLRYSGTQFQL